MKLYSRKLRVKIRSIKRPKLIMSVGIIIVMLIVTSGVVFARYSALKKSVKKPANQLVAIKTDQVTNTNTNTNTKPKSNITQPGSNSKSRVKPNFINPKCILTSKNNTFITEQKRHMDKLKELREYWLQKDGLDSDGYKNDIHKEYETNRQNMQDIMKPSKENLQKNTC